MVQPGTPEQSLPRRLAGWVMHRSPGEWIAGVSLAVLLGSGLFGGLDEVSPPTIPTLTTGERVTAAPFTVSVDAVTTGVVIPRAMAAGQSGISRTSTDGRFVIVRTTLTNTSDRAVNRGAVEPVVQLRAFPGALDGAARTPVSPADVTAHRLVTPARVLVAGDGSAVGDFQPGVTYDLAWLFEQATGAPRPDSVTVTVHGHTWRMDQLDFSMKWKDPEVAGTGTYPVTPGDERTLDELRGEQSAA